MCPDAPDEGGRCDHCPVDKLIAAQHSSAGLLLARASILRRKLKLGITISDDRLPSDEYQALLIIEEESELFEREKTQNG